MTPRCPHCGYQVTVARDRQGFAAWCACAGVSANDPHFRGTGRGETEEEAVGVEDVAADHALAWIGSRGACFSQVLGEASTLRPGVRRAANHEAIQRDDEIFAGTSPEPVSRRRAGASAEKEGNWRDP